MANCNTQQLNITCGTDVVLHDRLIFDGETFDPNLSVGIAANLVSSLGKRTALDVQVVDDELLISVPWIDGTLPGCYGLEVTGSCNSKKWATYADSLIKYTKATRIGVSEVTVESDSYDITQEVGYCYSNSPVTFAEVTVDDGYGTPSVDVEYEQRVLSMAFHNLKGNGITDIDVDEQVGDEAVNTVTIKTDADQDGTEFQVRNGSRGNGIASSSESLSDQDGGTNTFTITDDDGTVHEFHSKNGTKGSQGDSAVYDPSDPDAPDFVMANTTGQSTTKAMTQKAVTDAIDAVTDMVTESETFSSSDFTEQVCSLGTASYGWFRSSSTGPQRHVAMPVEVGQILRITPTSEGDNGFAGFLTSSYSPPYVVKNPVPYVAGTDRMSIPSGETQNLIIPEGCAYLVLTTVDGADAVCTWEIEVITSLKPHIHAIDEEIESIKDEISINIDIPTNAQLGNYISPDTNKWAESSDVKGMIVDVYAYRGNKIVISKNPNGTCQYAFLTLNNTIVGDSPHFCQGEALYEVPSSSSPLTREIPIDASYLYFLAYSNGVVVTPDISVGVKINDVLTEESFVEEGDVDVSSLTVRTCSIGTPNWYRFGNSGPQSHVALPVVPGEIYSLNQSSPQGASGYFAFLTSSYSPPAYGGIPVPFVSGTSRFKVDSGASLYITIPDDCAYLALNKVDGSGNTNNWVVKKGKVKHYIKDFGGDSPVKLRFAHWNIGHFSLGAEPSSSITHEQYPEMRAKWAGAINDICADFLLMCEYETYMVNAEGSQPAILASDAIFDLYQYQYIGSQPHGVGSYLHNAIFGNYKLKNITEVAFSSTEYSGRYYQVGDLIFGNTTIKVVETHLDFSVAETRAAQIQQLIDDFANFDYVIIAGDFNTNNGGNEFDAFSSAGYRMLNHGYLGDFPTYPAGTEPVQYLDNIVCKGFAINGIKVVNDDTLSDHCAVYADFTLIR